MKVWLEIQRQSDIDKRDVKPGEVFGTAAGACPGCGATPFLVQGQGKRRHNRQTYIANGVSKCCGESVGYIYARVDTIFGIEEDEAIGQRARVYSSG